MSDPALLARIHAASFTTTPRPWTAEEIASLLAQKHVFLLVDDTTLPQGFLIGSALAGEAELLTLAVAPAARRQGKAARLLADFIRTAEARGAESLFLEVAADNAAAIALYLAAGFHKAGLRRGYYRSATGGAIDALVLSRKAGTATDDHQSGN
ncbi:ribosomal protein S18-alanine N-acetyltransferase [Xinfangfangia sp. D13-10-4-6]|uniref:ribosomal protein S18-alanine N-acetyltransferase n=1 Tax=Pseudogemmobacter hezensis TaxID=2737662 RepID=UPI001558102E|nr:ribosomal protein S18-alanine N-acetyltransferase [Pseudogemmobacter hezensis]NPD17111.1 ribosomal protein S18-alanine N-acetyltransferase [Pseudogemmobacter hezensis]